MATSGLGAVFMANRTSLLRFLRARGAGDDCEDILQDLWIKLSAVSAQGPIADPLGYLYRMADNLMHDRFRAASRRGRRERVWSDVQEDDDQLYASPMAERVLIARDQLRQLEEALDTLGDRSRLIFRRFRIDGVSQAEIAREEGISLSAVEKHLQRAYRVIMATSSDDADGRQGSLSVERRL